MQFFKDKILFYKDCLWYRKGFIITILNHTVYTHTFVIKYVYLRIGCGLVQNSLTLCRSIESQICPAQPTSSSSRGRAVKASDQKSDSLRERRFESYRLRHVLQFYHASDQKSDSLWERRFESYRLRHVLQFYHVYIRNNCTHADRTLASRLMFCTQVLTPFNFGRPRICPKRKPPQLYQYFSGSASIS